jgi:hypothetical protein
MVKAPLRALRYGGQPSLAIFMLRFFFSGKLARQP